MVAIHIFPQYDSPDPERAPMIDLTHGQSFMIAITSRAAAVCAVLKNLLQDDVNAGTMAVKVVFGEC